MVDEVQLELVKKKDVSNYPQKAADVEKKQQRYDVYVQKVINGFKTNNQTFGSKVIWCGILLLATAILGGFFMFLMRQTIIVMSRHIEYDQKNEIFNHYLELDTNFYKTHSTGDLMSRISEDVSRVRLYTGPAIMYLINLAATIGFSLYFMFATQPVLTLYVLSPLPLLAITIYVVNTIIHKKSEHIQSLLSDLTTNAQESYSGIRVIKSFVQEKAMFGFFNSNAEAYKKNAIGLAKVEAIYFPSMALLIGLSTLLAILMGGIYAIQGNHNVTIGTITEFVMYISMLTFPVSAIGWTASMIQRAAASQKRLNEFLNTKPEISSNAQSVSKPLKGDIAFKNVDFIYPGTGIHALKNFNLHIKSGQKIAIIGHTGSGKTTIAQLMLRMYDPSKGRVEMDGIDIKEINLRHLRNQISYIPQDVFLFSDSITNNIAFGMENVADEKVRQAAKYASVVNEINGFQEKYQTLIGERGVTLSGGQKQRISIARGLLKESEIIIFDDCLSAVDSKTEKEILGNLDTFLKNKTSLIITHRIFSLFEFDKIIVLEEGRIVETGTHDQLLALNGYYTFLYNKQQQEQNRQGNGN